MINTARIWHMSVKVMQIIGNIILLQLFNGLLVFIGFKILLIPALIIINTVMINEYLNNSINISLKKIFQVLKENFVSIIVYSLLTFGLIIAYQQNVVIQKLIIVNNLGVISELLAMIFNIIIIFSFLIFTIYFPLINFSSDQSTLMKLKVTFIMPFYKFKVTIFLIISSLINYWFFTSNLLFIILFGPILLLAANIIIFKNKILIISDQEGERK